MFRLCVDNPASKPPMTGRKRRQVGGSSTPYSSATAAAASAEHNRLAEKKEAVVKVVREHIRNLLQSSNTDVIKVDFRFHQHETGTHRMVLRGRLQLDAVATRARDHAECVATALETSHGVRLNASLLRGVYRFFLAEPLNSLHLRRADYTTLVNRAADQVDSNLLATAATTTAATLAGGAASAGITPKMHMRCRKAQQEFCSAMKAAFLAYLPSAAAGGQPCSPTTASVGAVSAVTGDGCAVSSAASGATAAAAAAGSCLEPNMAEVETAKWLGDHLGAPSPARAKPFIQQNSKSMGRAQANEQAIMQQMEQNVIRPEQIEVTFDNIGGLIEAKTQVLESVVVPHRCPHLFQGVLADVTKGVLLYGPPGTGTLFARRKLTKLHPQ